MFTCLPSIYSEKIQQHGLVNFVAIVCVLILNSIIVILQVQLMIVRDHATYIRKKRFLPVPGLPERLKQLLEKLTFIYSFLIIFLN